VGKYGSVYFFVINIHKKADPIPSYICPAAHIPMANVTCPPPTLYPSEFDMPPAPLHPNAGKQASQQARQPASQPASQLASQPASRQRASQPKPETRGSHPASEMIRRYILAWGSNHMPEHNTICTVAYNSYWKEKSFLAPLPWKPDRSRSYEKPGRGHSWEVTALSYLTQVDRLRLERRKLRHSSFTTILALSSPRHFFLFPVPQLQRQFCS
jgi:hypothetical protein